MLTRISIRTVLIILFLLLNTLVNFQTIMAIYPGTDRTLPEKVVAQNSYIYVTGEGQLAIIDVSDPVRPQEVGYCTTSGFGNWGASCAIAVKGSYAFVVNYEYGLDVIDISNPCIPRKIANCATPGFAYDVTTSGNLVFVADEIGGLRVIDVSKPAAPLEIGNYTSSPSSPIIYYKVFACGNVVGITGNSVTLLDISLPNTPRKIIDIQEAYGSSFAVEGNYIYTAGSSGLIIMDIGNPAAPRKVSEYLADWSFSYELTIVKHNNLIYVANGNNGLDLVDVSNPELPQEKGRCSTVGNAFGVAVIGKYAYVTNYKKDICIIDVGNPNNPEIVGNYIPYVPTPTVGISSFPEGGFCTPNPFLPTRGQKTFFNFRFENTNQFYNIRIFNLRGQLQRTLTNTREWDGRNEAGHLCEGGVYVYQIEAEGKRVSGKVVLIK